MCGCEVSAAPRVGTSGRRVRSGRKQTGDREAIACLVHGGKRNSLPPLPTLGTEAFGKIFLVAPINSLFFYSISILIVDIHRGVSIVEKLPRPTAWASNNTVDILCPATLSY